jgi:hypothetical protein
MSDVPASPAGLDGPVPRALRVLASAENLGVLRSVHQPSSWLTGLQYRQGRIYLFDQGFVLGQGAANFQLFRWGRFAVRKAAGGYLINGDDGRGMVLGRKWTGFAELERAVTAGARQPETQQPETQQPGRSGGS